MNMRDHDKQLMMKYIICVTFRLGICYYYFLQLYCITSTIILWYVFEAKCNRYKYTGKLNYLSDVSHVLNVLTTQNLGTYLARKSERHFCSEIFKITLRLNLLIQSSSQQDQPETFRRVLKQKQVTDIWNCFWIEMEYLLLRGHFT